CCALAAAVAITMARMEASPVLVCVFICFLPYLLSACAEGFQDRILGATDQLSGSRRPRRNIVPLQPLGRGVSERDDRSAGAAVVRPPRRRAAWRSTVLRSHARGGHVAARDAPRPRRTCPKSEVDHERWHRHFEPHLGGGPKPGQHPAKGSGGRRRAALVYKDFSSGFFFLWETPQGPQPPGGDRGCGCARTPPALRVFFCPCLFP